MKIERQVRIDPKGRAKQCFTRRSGFITVGLALALTAMVDGFAQQPAASDPAQSDPRAAALINQVIERLAHGPSFDCKVRQRVRTAGREVVGVGRYLQVGGGTGQFSFQINMHDGDGKHTLQQISDGRLAWTRSEIAGEVSLSRVDVGWLDEGARTLQRDQTVKPSMRVGGPSEMLDTLLRDYDLKLGTSSLGGQPLLVVIGTLKQTRRQQIEASLEGASWPDLLPTRVNVAIAQQNDAETGFGKGLPVRIEHLSDPVALSPDPDKELESQLKSRQVISLVEFYSIRPVAPPPIERFRFENQDAEIDFVNETSRYENRFKIQVSAKERARYR